MPASRLPWFSDPDPRRLMMLVDGVPELSWCASWSSRRDSSQFEPHPAPLVALDVVDEFA